MSTSDPGLATTYIPPASGDQWETIDPTILGWDRDKLEDVLRYADAKNSSGLIILARGRILVERYWREGGTHATGDVASAQKSVTSLLIGIAQADGFLKIEDTVGRWLGEGWSNAPPAVETRITLRHLLTMTSGLDDRLAAESEQGAAWYYNTPAYHLLKGVLEVASGQSVGDFSRERLFSPIGMQDASWQPRPNMLAPLGARALAAGVAARPLTALMASTRDLARLGLLVLEQGRWNGSDVIEDRSYFSDSLKPSQSLNPAYGYLWWLNGKDRYVLAGRGRGGEGPMIPAAPPDMVCALGAGDKKVYVCPEIGLVVARHGAASGQTRDEALSSFDNELWQRIVNAVPH